ncbi:FAD-dependent oxidoreductase [Candidatus Hakubella thermalkaliphila]|uniref:FAD-dependent oxidoreductase n=1 Tax=Candidatus Hakubella thermalkaliphila TaxID=2754717 RepID=UPI0021591D56|nr:FAD-dependent oxidoreductase [Candidatus Hakubella thermalkaliphila]
MPNSEFARGVVAVNSAGEIEVDRHCQTNVPGIFAAGDVTSVPEKQIIVAAGEGAKAALGAYGYLLEQRG